jgi:hypothetical protein
MIVQTACTVFKYNVLSGAEDFNSPSPYVYKIALYTANADLNSGTVAYTTTEEITGTGYTAGGQTLTPTIGSDSSDGVAYVSFSNVTWNPAGFTCRGALIYNSTTGAAVAVLNFGSDKTAATSFTIQFPSATSTSAILRIN